ncbi:MAG: efflux RND transporter periplasmic adaptor subunit [Acidobacteriota bacterium]
MKRKIALILLLLMVGASGFFLKDEAREWLSGYIQPEQKEPVPTILLNKRDYQVSVTADGELTGLKTTPAVTPRVRGSLKIAWLAPEGALVRQGDPVVLFDSTEAQLTLETNENTFTSYGHRIKQTRQNAQTEETVLGMNFLAADEELDYAENQIRKDEEIFSQWEIQESIMSAALAGYRRETLEEKGHLNKTLSQADLRILGIERRKAQSEIEQAQQTLSSMQVQAPTNGVVLYKRYRMAKLEVGQEVWSGQQLIEIADLGQFQGQLQVPESDIAGIEEGKKVAVRLNSLPEQAFPGVVTQIAKIPQQYSRNDPRKYFECRVLLDVPLDLMEVLKPGMKLTGIIEVSMRKEALVLPKSAVIKKAPDFIVFLKEGDDYVEKKIRIIDSDHGFYVIDGIDPGSRVCLQHPFEEQKLMLPDFNAPSSTNTRGRGFIIFN